MSKIVRLHVAALSALLALLWGGSARAVPSRPDRLEQPAAAGEAPSVAMDTGALRRGARNAAAPLRQEFDRADFMEDTPDEIARENRRNPWQAWALAFFPTLIVKGVTLTLAMVKAETEQWAVFMPLVPSMGISHYWETEVWWAGLIATVGDLVGGSLLTYYFAQLYEATSVNPPDKTMLYAGIAVTAIFFVYENVSAPIVANWQNKKLRQQFTPARSEEESFVDPTWRRSPWPDRGRADIGPGLRLPAPVGAAWSFSF